MSRANASAAKPSLYAALSCIAHMLTSVSYTHLTLPTICSV